MIEWRMNTVRSTSQPPQWTEWRILDFHNSKISNIRKATTHKNAYDYEYRVGGTNGRYFSSMNDELCNLMEQEIMWEKLND